MSDAQLNQLCPALRPEAALLNFSSAALKSENAAACWLTSYREPTPFFGSRFRGGSGALLALAVSRHRRVLHLQRALRRAWRQPGFAPGLDIRRLRISRPGICWFCFNLS